MDILELLISQSIPTAPNVTDSEGIKISYFDKMMVVRDLVRKLKQSDQLVEAKTKLENITKMDIEDIFHEPFISNTLGILYDQEGETSLSLQTHQSALTAVKADYDDPRLIWTRNEMGRVYRHMNELDKSEDMHAKALSSLSAQLPAEHPELIWTYNTLASTLRKQGRPSEALVLHTKAYDARKKALGDLHPHTLWSGSDIAKCYRDEGRFEDSLVWYRRTYDGRLSTLGPDHPDTLWSKNDLGLILDSLGHRGKALQIQVSALQAQESVLGVDHPHTLWTRNVVQHLTQ
ncbi:hypothetical protein F4859DRAFT_521131 [Xylaria cf. heliscus]|nr:hypothetical protein F4859DRAFT_521131 [Xylaria cf. heliscus]